MNAFDVIDLSGLPESHAEQMGSKDKFWVDLYGVRWLFKHPRSGTGEHWAERVVAELAQLVGTPAAQVEFAVRHDGRGTVSKSFLASGESLVHGNELMAAVVEGYDPDRQFRQREHRLDLVLECVGNHAKVHPTGGQHDATHAFVGYLVLDALVGNTDRHHENWAVIKSTGSPTRLAPTYDHASSLGRELSDQKRTARLQSWGVAHYINHGRGGIYPVEGEKQVPPVALLDELVSLGYGQAVSDWCRRIADVGLVPLQRPVDQVPDGWISDAGKAFAKAVIEVGFDHTANTYGR